MGNDYKSRMAADNEQASKILRGEAPVQATKGVMSNAERKASIASAFGAKAEPKEDELVFKFGNNYQKD
jgi:hypothetical protein